MVDFIYWSITVGFVLGFSSWVALGIWLAFWQNWRIYGSLWIIMGAWMVSYSIWELAVNHPMKTEKPPAEVGS